MAAPRERLASFHDFDPARVRTKAEQARLDQLFPRNLTQEARMQRVESVQFDTLSKVLDMVPTVERAREYLDDEDNARQAMRTHAQKMADTVSQSARITRIREHRTKLLYFVFLGVMVVAMMAMWMRLDPVLVASVTAPLVAVAIAIVQMAVVRRESTDGDSIRPPPMRKG